MRYPIKLVPTSEAFGPDVKLGIQLLPEQAIVVPPPTECPECPETPPSDCVVSCDGWVWSSYLFFGDAFWVNAVGVVPCPGGGNVDIYGNPGTISLFAQFNNRCGHATQIVWTPGGLDGYVNFQEIPNVGEHWSIGVQLFWADGAPPTGASGTLSIQIDLTDAIEGSETWTDVCCPVTITAL